MKRWGRLREELERRLSPGALAELIDQFGGQVIRVPTPTLTEQRRRRQRVRDALDAGETYHAAASIVGASVRTVVRDAKRCA